MTPKIRNTLHVLQNGYRSCGRLTLGAEIIIIPNVILLPNPICSPAGNIGQVISGSIDGDIAHRWRIQDGSFHD